MATSSETLVVSLGGNAISVPGEQGTIEEQFAHTQRTSEVLAAAVVRGFQPVITHGNGPQVGNVLRRVELAKHQLYPIPLELCVADTQAGMGYMIAQCLMNELVARGDERHVTTIVTTVLVDQHDPAFANATKPIGPWLEKSVAESHQRVDGWQVREFVGSGYRRVVPSPKPVEILELDVIRHLVDNGDLVICCGGGGIPVCRDEHGRYNGTAAVIDKDNTSALLARCLGVSTLVYLTAVENVCLDFGKPTQEPLRGLTVDEAQRYLVGGQFGIGSMQPKVAAAIDFVVNARVPQPVAIIGHLKELDKILAGESGTRIVR